MLSLHGMSHDAWNRYSDKGSWYYEVVEEGFKYNLTDIQSAIGIHQLRKLDSFVEQRKHYAQIYNQAFAGMEELEAPSDDPRARHAWHLYMLRLNLDHLKIDRAVFINKLRSKGIGASVHFIPIPLHPFFARMNMGTRPCRRALNMYQRLVSLPLYPAMSEEQVHYVANTVKSIVAANRSRSQVLLSEAG